MFDLGTMLCVRLGLIVLSDTCLVEALWFGERKSYLKVLLNALDGCDVY